MEQKFYSLRTFRKILGVSAQTLRNWDVSGKLKPHHTDPNGNRYYSEQQLQKITNNTEKDNRISVGYCRVATESQKTDLAQQVEVVKEYLQKEAREFKIIEDVGSGIDYNKEGLKELFALIDSEKIAKIVLLHQDRLVRLGFDLIKNFADLHNVKIEIIKSEEKTDEQEVFEDMLQTLTIVSQQLDRQRANKLRAVLEELKGEISL
ncbi:MAG: IS607 family transposase [Desulfovibrio sp.]|nr:IS607 family transposase [Desulfovibrio sp.]